MKSLYKYNQTGFSRSIRFYLITFFTFGLFMIGCSPAPTFIKSDYEQQEIKSIAIIPVIDKRNIDEDTIQVKESISNIEELLSKKIIEKHYDVITPSTVKNLIKEKEIQDLSPKNLSAILNVDGILFSELYDYSDKFFVNHSIKMRFNIYDAQGDSLWINELDDSDKPFLSAIGASLGWAIGVAVDNKISSKSKLPTILAGVAAAQLIYVVVDGLSDETSQSIDGAFKSLPDAKSTMRWNY